MIALLLNLFLIFIVFDKYSQSLTCSSPKSISTFLSAQDCLMIPKISGLNAKWSPSPLSMSLEDDNNQNELYTFQVSHEGRTLDIQIDPNETILSALERTAAHDYLSLHSLPSDCRRGNCLTCSGRHLPDSVRENILKGEDGLNPSISRRITGTDPTSHTREVLSTKSDEFVLTCSSYVIGNGVKLELGVNSDAWERLYSEILNDSDAERVRREAVAKVLRKSDERNYDKWIETAEKMIRDSEN
mmetsp:Transcript_7258/g.10395  ORF Transcript_7258/g.10395 Transcript_7258/m.10395 type:complete len:244 (-) Transcript_7258:156-887(-)